MKASVEEISARLLKHPELVDHVSHLLDIIDNQDGQATLADDAEGRVVKEMREFGKSVLERWATDEAGRREAIVLNSGVHVKKKTKKNFTGTPLTEQST